MSRPSHTYAAARLVILGKLGFNAAALLIHAAARPYTAKSVGLWNPQCRGIIWLCRDP